MHGSGRDFFFLLVDSALGPEKGTNLKRKTEENYSSVTRTEQKCVKLNHKFDYFFSFNCVEATRVKRLLERRYGHMNFPQFSRYDVSPLPFPFFFIH
jgi:hypothetical protein